MEPFRLGRGLGCVEVRVHNLAKKGEIDFEYTVLHFFQKVS